MIALLLGALPQESPFRLYVHPKDGLQVTVRGVPVVDGTWFQMYESDWSKGYLSSARGGEVVTQADGTVQVRFQSADGLASAVQTFQPVGERLRVRSRFEWRGAKPIRVEATAGMVGAAAVQAGALVAGDARIELAGRTFPKGADLAARRLAPDGKAYRFEAPLADVEVNASQPITLFDARGYDQPWALNRSLLWLGVVDVEVAPERPLEYEVEWRFAPHPASAERKARLSIAPRAMASVEGADENPLPLVPRPKVARLDSAKAIEVTGAYKFPVGRVRFWDVFLSGLDHRFLVPAPVPKAKPLTFDAGVSKLSRRPGGYEITIRPDGRVSVLGEEDEGLRNGLRRLASLAFVRDGRLWLPTGVLQDEPALDWRGVHLFVGPEAKSFQGRLWERVLLPMGFNKVVLQCERTQWKTTPIDPGEQPMSREDLAALFAAYRADGVEPIPLIQSVGHMEWFFAGGRRLDLAVNREVPYTLDFRKPEAAAAIKTLWAEAVELLKPKTVHVGGDEIDMRGFPAGSEALTTEIWERAMPELGGIAKAAGARMMVWGDQALAPGEAPDAALAPTKAEAARRRKAIPPGSQIADWHYLDDARPERFYPTLQLWKRDGFRPVAAGWYRPNNVRGLALAADLERAGYLQTTWAGYQSNEANMLRNLDQFSAMVLAGDYTWSARQEPVEKLGYDPADLFRRLYFGRRSPVKPVPGTAYGDGEAIRIGNLGFRRMPPVSLRSALTREGADAPTELEIPLRGSVARLGLALEAAVEAPDGETVAEVVVEFAQGDPVRRPLQYGRHLRTGGDPRMVPYGVRDGGLVGLVLELGRRGEIRTVRIKSTGAYGGVRVHGMTTW
ncbi:MAG: hypothetical protein ACO1SV_19630 [Fimbriimonas sp.]